MYKIVSATLKSFVLGCAIGVAVWAGMAGMDASGVLEMFGASFSGPLTNVGYTASFFGVIQGAAKAVTEFITPTQTTPENVQTVETSKPSITQGKAQELQQSTTLSQQVTSKEEANAIAKSYYSQVQPSTKISGALGVEKGLIDPHALHTAHGIAGG